MGGPTFIGTDNTANQRVASGAAVPARSKHFLRRYHVLLERVRSREITIGHVPDRSMPADFLTKWIGASKLNVSVEHVTNRRHAPVQPEAICLRRIRLGGVLGCHYIHTRSYARSDIDDCTAVLGPVPSQ